MLKKQSGHKNLLVYLLERGLLTGKGLGSMLKAIRGAWKPICGQGIPSRLWKSDVRYSALLAPSGNTSASSSATDFFYIWTQMTLSGISLTALAFLVKH